MHDHNRTELAKKHGGGALRRTLALLPLAPLRAAGLSALLIGLAGCAGATVSKISVAQPAGPAPSEILVAVDAVPTENDAQARTEQRLVPELQAALVERLTRARVTAEAFVPGSGYSEAAILHVSIVEADPGSLAERFVVGFGLGRARLQARTALESAGGSDVAALTTFDTSSDSGMKPGLILPGGVALATGNIIHLAIGGGIDIAMNWSGGLAQPATSTASAIVVQLRKYYASAGWHWPAGDET